MTTIGATLDAIAAIAARPYPPHLQGPTLRALHQAWDLLACIDGQVDLATVDVSADFVGGVRIIFRYPRREVRLVVGDEGGYILWSERSAFGCDPLSGAALLARLIWASNP